ncbi:MAG: hypothetical protein AMXMBFR84_13800 [Candidatus Hydrogenedentota bacterium]
MYPHWNRTPSTEVEWFEALASLARYLRGPDGCPWDREQSSSDFARYAVEEAREWQDSYERGDNRHIEEEFGDTLFVMLAAAAAAEEEGRFNLKNAMVRAHEKMIRRHEHVFGEEKASTPEEAIAMWNRIKAKEKEQSA